MPAMAAISNTEKPSSSRVNWRRSTAVRLELMMAWVSPSVVTLVPTKLAATPRAARPTASMSPVVRSSITSAAPLPVWLAR